MMRAVRVHAFGGPDSMVYEEVPRPEAGPGEVLIRIHAAALNPLDWVARSGFAVLPEAMRPKLDLPFTPGTDVSGVVAGVGNGVSQWREGDEVFGLVRFPGLVNGGKAYARYTTSPASHLARKPAGVDHVHAAAVPMAGLTAYQTLFDHIRLERGKTVLVNGAAGGVGHFAVQLAKATGAQVIGVASGRHAAFLRDLGVDQFIDYTTTAVEKAARDVDHVIDTVGGPRAHRLLPLVKPGGTISPVTFGDYREDRASELGISFRPGQVRSDGAQMSELARLMETGRVRPRIDSVFPLTDASHAHRRAEQGHIQGKIVLQVI
ncbi:NADP-dependent oxidoreductase [Nonomuraea sp. NPDC046802]|uniref:NADP-dependent oxidoreductase n=1 Tax=Nonomuraea sp. NPDC046802 TaxID=3154919 RepID=UPI0033D09910